MRVWTKKTICRKCLRKFSKIFFRKLLKMHYFSIFFEKFNKPCVNFLRVWTKKTIYWKFWDNFWKFSSENCLKCIVLADFSNKLTNYALIFCEFGQTQIVGKFWENFEIFWWTIYRKIEFFILFIFIFIFFENLLLKIELSEITPFFYNNLFGFGGISSLSPLATPLLVGYCICILPICSNVGFFYWGAHQMFEGSVLRRREKLYYWAKIRSLG